MVNTLRVRPITNFNMPEGVEINLTCFDPDGLSASNTFRLTLTPVNDAPNQFVLIEPRDRNEIADFQAEFIWNIAWDIDGDTLDYQFRLNIIHGEVDSIYNLSGQRVETLVNGRMQAGVYRETLNCRDLPSGLYFVKLEGAGETLTRKIMLIK